MRDWKHSDLRKLFDSALDAFTVEFYVDHTDQGFGSRLFRDLPDSEKLKVLRAAQKDFKERFSYAWMMRTANEKPKARKRPAGETKK